MKVTKISISPSRTINLSTSHKDHGWAKLSMSVEITFDKPVDVDGKEVREAFDKARKMRDEEYKKQYEVYKNLD